MASARDSDRHEVDRRANVIRLSAALADPDTEPGEDHLASRDCRRHLARVLTRRALERAAIS
jgi:carbon-monoxide dehydrogenase medium subunit